MPPLGGNRPKLALHGADGLPRIEGAQDFAAHFGVSERILVRLERYAALLRRWQSAVNLVAPATLDDVWRRHFADSAQLSGLAAGARRWLDMGSGAGFPGLVIAIMAADESDRHVTLIESQARKCAFLAEVARETGVAVEIAHARIESLASKPKVTDLDVITARALAPLERLISLSSPLFGPKTIGLFPKGKRWREEIEAAKATWTFHVKLAKSRTDRQGRIIEIREPILRG